MATTETRGKERARERERERAKREADREGEGESNARATRATEETRETSRTHPVVCIVRKLSACYSTSYTVSYHLSPMPTAFRPLSALLQLCNTWLERKLIEQKCVTKVSVSVTCPGGLAW